MAGTLTDPRFIARTAVAIDWQATEGEAVPTPPLLPKQFIVAQNLSRNPDPTYLRPNGTHGSIHERFDGDRIISQAYKKELKMWGSRMQLLPFIESVMSGLPTVAFTDMTVSGAQSANITALSFTGVRPHHNTSPYVSSPPSTPNIYITLVGGGFPFTVNFYRDSARTLLVGTCSVTAAATPTAITASGGSGLGGSITLGGGSAAGNADALLNKIFYFFDNQFTRFFRLYHWEGEEVTILSDCVVNELTLESSENGELSATVQIMARRRTFATTNLTVLETQLDLVSYSHSELTLTKNPSGSPVTPVVDSFMFKIANNVLQYIGNAVEPQKLIKRGFVTLGGSFQGESGDELKGIIGDERANTAVAGGMITMRADYLLSTKTLRLDMPVKVRPRLAEPGIAAELIEKTEVEFDVLYDGVTAPLAISVQL